MTTKVKVGLVILAVLLCVGLGYGIATWRHQAWIAGYEKREQQRMAQVDTNTAQQNQLRGENKALREHVAKLSAEDEAMKAIIENRGGVIAAEAKNLEKINEELKNDQAVINAPTDRCTRCRRFSEIAVANRQIGKPLTCKDECAGTNR